MLGLSEESVCLAVANHQVELESSLDPDHARLHRNALRRQRRRILRYAKVPFQWSTPGHGEKGERCGSFPFTKYGCLNVSSHPEGKIYVEHHAQSCRDPRCPVCSPKWIAREASRSRDRIMAGWDVVGSPPKHIILSPPVSARNNFNRLDTYIQQRNKAYRVAKSAGIVGGELIFHPFRDNGEFSPHFHMIGFGWVDSHQAFSKTGWVVKNLGVRDTQKKIYGTLRYELDHCGIPQKMAGRTLVSPITWFGEVAYNKLKVPKRESELKCPYCGAPLVAVRWWGLGDHPCQDLDVGEYLLDPSGWDFADSYWVGGDR